MDAFLYLDAPPLVPQPAPVRTRAQVRILDAMRTPGSSPDPAAPVLCTFPCTGGPCDLVCRASGAAITRCQKHNWCPPTYEEAMLVQQYEVAVKYYQDEQFAQDCLSHLQKLQKSIAAAHEMAAKGEPRACVPYNEIFPRAQVSGQPLPMPIEPLAAAPGGFAPLIWPAPGYELGSGRPSPVPAARAAVSCSSSAPAAAAGVNARRRLREPEDGLEDDPCEVSPDHDDFNISH